MSDRETPLGPGAKKDGCFSKPMRDSQTVDGNNSIKSKIILVGERTTYFNSDEWINAYVVILPNEN